MKDKAFIPILLIATLTLCACAKDELDAPRQPASDKSIRVGLQYASFGNATRSSQPLRADYDLVKFLITTADGTVIDNMKGYYDTNAACIYVEGLQPGEYRLLITGVKGNHIQDGATFETISHADETWLHFPQEQTQALTAEYFHSVTPFTVSTIQTSNGTKLVTDLPGSIEQKRIVGRVDVTLHFDNPYTEDAILSAQTKLHEPVFYTELSGNGDFAGARHVGSMTLDMATTTQFLLLPTVADNTLNATVDILTRNYRGERIHRSYTVSHTPVTANHIGTLQVAATHPEDGNGTMFITDKAYHAGNHKYILQDDEHHDIYTDKTLRNFNTSQPMQISVTDGGELNVRFYSPKPVSDVLVRAHIPAAGNEYIDLAYFDTVPAFADFLAGLPAASASLAYRTETGRIVELPRLSIDELQQAHFKITSPDPYWTKLQEIKHGWNIRFDLYGGDPTRPDGGPNGNWMGIRPVHCREVVAFFLNFTFMIDMPEHEEILRANEDRLYGNGGINDKVTAETVLAQMRQNRSIRVGLVYTGNLVMGLGGGDVFGAYQGGWFEHYTSAYACEVMFHELGHVMGYSHDSSFTYGPWAQELMNNFYINNLSKMPVESPHYLNSASNPNKY